MTDYPTLLLEAIAEKLGLPLASIREEADKLEEEHTAATLKFYGMPEPLPVFVPTEDIEDFHDGVVPPGRVAIGPDGRRYKAGESVMVGMPMTETVRTVEELPDFAVPTLAEVVVT